LKDSGIAKEAPMTPRSERSSPTEHLGWFAALGVLALLALAVSLVAVATGEGSGASSSGGGGLKVVDVVLTEFAVEPASVEVEAGTEVVVNVTNAGEMVHDLKLDGATGTDMLDPGESVEGISLGTVDASTQAWCTVPGHKESGM